MTPDANPLLRAGEGRRELGCQGANRLYGLLLAESPKQGAIKQPIAPWHPPLIARGFTLTEMLVVIAIISTLAALVLGALSAARRTAREKAVQATILVLESAIDRYSNDFDDYPPSDGDPERGGRLLVQCLMTEKKDGPYLRSGDVRTCDPERCGEVSFSDEWNRSIKYLHHRDYENREPNKHTFRLMSAGPDGVFEDGVSASDDIVNWDKSKVKR